MRSTGINASLHPPEQRRRRTTSQERVAIGVLTALTAFASVSSGASPTGIGLVDNFYLAAAGAMVALAGSRSRRWAWIVSALASLWVAGGLIGKLLGVVALSFGFASALKGRARWMGSALSLPVVIVVGSLDAGSFHGATTVMAIAVVAPILLSALFHLTEQARQAVVGAVTVAAAFIIFAAVLFAASVALAAGNVNDGVTTARQGFDTAADGDSDSAAALFDEAGAHFDSARKFLSGPWMLPARLVPIVGQHARATQVLSSEGVSLAETAAETARTADIDSIRVVNGAVDLTTLDALAPELERAERAVERAATRITDARSPWLLGTIDHRMAELEERLQQALPAARTAALAAREVPGLLGANREVRWLVALTTPAEARGLGGLLGNYATITAIDGQLAIESIGRNEDMNILLANANAQLSGPDEYVRRWGAFRPEEFFHDVTLSPDLPAVAAVIASLYEQATGDAIDGVIVADAYVIGAVLEITGPIRVDDRRLDADSAVDFLLREQYADFEDDELGRVRILQAIISEVFEAITSGSLPGPRALAVELGPMVDQDRLGAWWDGSDGADELFAATGLDGRFPESAGGDLLAVVHQNSGQNKIDVFLERAIHYDLVISGSELAGTVTVELSNDAPERGLPLYVIGSNDQGFPLGTNAMLLSLYTALDVRSVRIDGIDVGVARQTEFGVEVTDVEVMIPAQSQVLVEIDVAGTIDRVGHLTMVQQPLVTADQLIVTVDFGDGPLVAYEGALDRDLEIPLSDSSDG